MLLIVAVLGVKQLKDLIDYARKMNIEPLVEVNTEREMEIALDCGAKVIGINNRNLHTFQLDMNTTPRVLQVIQQHNKVLGKDVCVAALSGITTSDEVHEFQKHGVQCCLVGETLMKAENPQEKIKELFFSSSLTSDANQSSNRSKRLVKVCGMSEPSIVQQALQKGTNLIGLIFASSSKRKIKSIDNAKEIIQVVRKYGERDSHITQFSQLIANTDKSNWYLKFADFLNDVTLRRPLTVGVFQDQPIEEVNYLFSIFIDPFNLCFYL